MGCALDRSGPLDAAAIARLFAPIAGERVEVAAIAYLCGRRRLLGMRQTRTASCAMLHLPLRAIATDALSLDARSILIAHNHPSGDPRPSRGDIDATRLLVRVLHPLDLRIDDHLVLTRHARTSFAEQGLL